MLVLQLDLSVRALRLHGRLRRPFVLKHSPRAWRRVREPSLLAVRKASGDTGVIGIWRCTCRDWLFSPASKPIDLALGFQVHWVHMQVDFPESTLVGTLKG
jgi:hypothetical protein